MKHSKFLIFVVLFAMLTSLFLAAAYNDFSTNDFQVNSLERIPLPPQLQIFSPEENGTYQTTNVPLNITANNATAKITYSLDGGENITLNESTNTSLLLSYGVHNITVYGFDSEGKVGDYKNITFTLVYPYAPTLKLTMLQVQETIDYFEAMGLKVQVLDTNKPQNCLYADSVDVESKEDLTNYAIAKGINVIYEVLDLKINYVGFCANYYNNSPLPTVYNYSATLYSTS